MKLPKIDLLMTEPHRTIDSNSSDAEIVRFLNRVKSDLPEDDGVAADLAAVLARSGQVFGAPRGVTADVASTGGPTSLSTLLCPLYLRAGGLLVPKLGVPGRPAGGIDCLAQIEGYKVALADSELETIIQATGYAHFVASGRYAPLDARVFKLRQLHGAQAVPALVAASLLSKKMAVGVQRAGLDVRVAQHNNFGRTWDEARRNAAMFVRAAARHGIAAFPVLTDGTHPYQPYIGRSEAVLALARLLDSSADGWLDAHDNLCRHLALAAAPENVREVISRSTRSDLRSHFLENLESQGASEAAFQRVAAACEAGHTRVLRASSDGFAIYALEQIRRILVGYQESVANAETAYPDPVGLILLCQPGEWVANGAPVATLRIGQGLNADQVVQDLEPAVCRPSRSPLGRHMEGIIQ